MLSNKQEMKSYIGIYIHQFILDYSCCNVVFGIKFNEHVFKSNLLYKINNQLVTIILDTLHLAI